MLAAAPEVRFTLLSNAPSGLGAPNLVEIMCPAPDHSIRSALWMHRVIDKLGADLVHSPFTFAPWFVSTPLVVTVHDLMAVRAPQLIHRGLRRWLSPLYMRPWFRASVRRARAVLVPTNTVAADVRLEFDQIAPRVVVTSEGIDLRFRQARVRPSGRRYVLAYGNARPYKNLPRLVDAFALLAHRIADVDLWLVGRLGAHRMITERRIAKLDLGSRVHWRDAVSDDELAALLGGASALAFPSLYEGFGLPIVEAMASGCPVVTAEGGATAEVAGGAASLCDPTRASSIATAIELLLSDPIQAEDLRVRGRARSQQFSWEIAARRTLEVYRDVASGCSS